MLKKDISEMTTDELELLNEQIKLAKKFPAKEKGKSGSGSDSVESSESPAKTAVEIRPRVGLGYQQIKRDLQRKIAERKGVKE